MKTAKPAQDGFTLVELMITISIAAILMTVAAPSFVSIRRNSELTSNANTLIAAINAARSEAMKRGSLAMMVPTGTTWASGWRIFVDVDRSGTFNSGDVTVDVHADALPSYFTVASAGTAAAASPYVLFDASGYARTTTGAFSPSMLELKRNDVSTAASYGETRRIKIGTSGRIRVCKPTNASDTTCSSAAD